MFSKKCVCVLLSALMIYIGISVSPAKENITSIQQLNDSSYTVAVSESGADFIAVKRNLPKANIIYASGQQGYDVVKMGKADAYAFDRIQMEIAIANGLTGVKILPGSIGEKVKIAVGISRASKIPDLKGKVNQFISEIKASGIFQDMYQRWVFNGQYTMPDIDTHSSSGKKLVIGTIGLVMPYSFYEGNTLTGFDIELGNRLASWLGTEIEFRIYDYGGLIAAAHTGEIDCIMANLNYTPERAEKIDFSDTLFTEETALIVKGNNSQPEPEIPSAIKAFDGKRIAVFTGTVHAEIVKELLPSAELLYFDSNANGIAALTSGKVDAIVNDDSILREIVHENPSLTCINEYLKTFDNAFIFAKTSQGDKLRNEINEFIRTLKSDGTLKKILDVWTGRDDSLRTLPDYEHYPDINGTLKIALDFDNLPFNYIKNGKLVGYDVDIIVRFCESKGYRPEFSGMDFSAVVPSVFSGKGDIGIGAITITEERKESVNFSEPVYTGGAMLLVLKNEKQNTSRAKYTSIDDLAGKKIGVQAGTRAPEVAKKLIPTAELMYYDTPADNLIALRSRKVDAVCMPESTARFMMYDNDDVVTLGGKLTNTKIASIFSKTEKGKKLCKEYEEFVKSLWDDGTIDKINSVWFDRDENKHILKDYTKLPATNGTLKMAVDIAMPPMVFVRDNQIIGYDIDIAVRFCEAKGYALKIVPMSFQAIIPAVQSEKCDFSCGMTCTPERAESVLFSSTPNIEVGSVMLIRKSDAQKAPAKSYAGFSTISDLAGKRIAVVTGSTHPDITLKFVPTAKLAYFDTVPDTFTALRAEKVDAVCAPISMAKLVMTEDNSIAFFGEQLTYTECAPIFAKTENGRKLCDEFSEFLKAQWENGIIQEIDSIWFGSDESKKVVKDYSALPATNGKLRMAADVSMPPMVYVKDNKIMGYDVDCVVRFCEAYGYGLEIVPMNFNGVIPAVQTEKCDFGICGITRTDEREESVLFSYPNIKAGNAFVVRKSDIASDTQKNSGRYTSLHELERKKIGVQTGTTSARSVAERLPNAQIEYFDALSDILIALKTGKIDALACTIFAATDMMNHNDDVIYLDEWLKTSEISPIFTKSDKGKKLCEEYGEFVKSLWTDGTISTLKSIWLGKDDSKKIVKDYSSLPAPNGSIKMCVDTSWPPLAYVKDNKVVGYDIDIAVRFCEAKGYGLEIFPSSISGMIAAVQSGKCDFSQSVNVTEERAQIALFPPTPTAKSGNVIVVMKSELQSDNANSVQYTRLQDLSGKKVGIILGANHDIFVAEKIPSAKIEYFNDLSAITLALQTGKIDAFTNTLPTAIYMTHEHKDMSYVYEPLENTYTYSAFTNSDKGHKVCNEYAEFMKSLWDDGTIKRLSDKWIYSENEQLRTMEDYSKLPADNGVLKMAIDTGRMPFAYVKDNKITGYDIEIAAMFCKSKGYGLEVYPMDFAGILGSIKTGKCDLTGSITRTEERAETMLFSPVPNAETPIVLIVMKSPESEKSAAAKQNPATEKFTEAEKNIFFDELKASFERTFIREDRWKLFADGIISTMIITVLSILFGTILGFIVYLSCRGGNIIANLITRFFVWLLQGMPMVVLLMILYYIIFGKVDIAGIWVAVIAFSLIFGAGVYEMLLSGVNALDKGQLEAAYALGFTDSRAFFTIILPQAALHFMPAYKGEVVALIKATAIVGYIAVQDLTKMGDIVRSRTYEAFFPLIAVAVIYFVLAGLLNVIVGIIHNRIRPEKRTKSDILRGIETHD